MDGNIIVVVVVVVAFCTLFFVVFVLFLEGVVITVFLNIEEVDSVLCL